MRAFKRKKWEKKTSKSFEHQAELVRNSRLMNTSLTQQDLANLLGYEKGQFVSNVERGLCGYPSHAWLKVCNILKISKKELLEAFYNDLAVEFSEAVGGWSVEELLDKPKRLFSKIKRKR